MSPGLEFVDADAGSGGAQPDDLLDTTPAEPGWYARALAPLRRHPVVQRGVVAALAVAALAVGASAVAAQHTVVAGRGSAAVVADPVSVVPYRPSPLGTVQSLAATVGALPDYVRQNSPLGACPTVGVGSKPTRSIARQVRVALPDFTVTDVASTLDQFSGLCAVRLRARNAEHVVLVLVISPPTSGPARTALPFAPVQVGTDLGSAGKATNWASATTVRHWTIVIGAVGDLDDLPSSATLQRLVQQDTLTW